MTYTNVDHVFTLFYFQENSFKKIYYIYFRQWWRRCEFILLLRISVRDRPLLSENGYTTPLIFVIGGRFPLAVREPPRDNRMLVTKALPHDVAFLALVPLCDCGVSPGHAFPAGVAAFHYNHFLFFKIRFLGNSSCITKVFNLSGFPMISNQ